MQSAEFRQRILERDQVCQKCGAYEHLHAHHIVPVNEGGADDPENGIALCAECHAAEHPDMASTFFTHRRPAYGEIKKSIGIALYEQHLESFEICQSFYGIESASELIRFLITQEAKRIRGIFPLLATQEPVQQVEA